MRVPTCVASEVPTYQLPERLNKAISVEGIHGTPEGSNITLDGYGFICICQVYIPVYISDHSHQSIISDGILTEHGFQVSKTGGKISISPPTSKSVWYSLSIDHDGRAYVDEELLRRPPKVSIFSLRNAWHSRLGHRSHGYLEAMRRLPQYVEAGFNIEDTKSSIQRCEHCLLAKATRSHYHPCRCRAKDPGRLWYNDGAGGGQRTPSIVYGYIYRTVWVESKTQNCNV